MGRQLEVNPMRRLVELDKPKDAAQDQQASRGYEPVGKPYAERGTSTFCSEDSAK
jgi:hypothetical protein